MMKSLRYMVLAALVVAVTAYVAVAVEEKPVTTKPAAAVVNAKDPMCGMAVDPAKVTDDTSKMFKDLKVAFCSKDCVAAWDKLSDTDKEAKLLAALGKPVNAKCPVSGMAVAEKTALDNVRMFSGKLVGFCCNKCPTAWDKLTDAEKAAKLKAVMPPPVVKG